MIRLVLLGLLATAFAHPHHGHGGKHGGRKGRGSCKCRLETLEELPKCHMIECRSDWDLRSAKEACINNETCDGVNFSVLKQWCTHSNCLKPGDPDTVPDRLPIVEAIQQKQQAEVEQNDESSSSDWDAWDSSSSEDWDKKEFGPLDYFDCRDDEGNILYREYDHHWKSWMHKRGRCAAGILFLLCCCCCMTAACCGRKKRRGRCCSRRQHLLDCSHKRKRKCKKKCKGKKCKRSPDAPKAITLADVWTAPHNPSPLVGEKRVGYKTKEGEKTEKYPGITAVTIDYEEQDTVTTTKVTHTV